MKPERDDLELAPDTDPRRPLPHELALLPALRWPRDVAQITSIPEPTLKKLRADGDHPRLYAIGRALFTKVEDVRAWIEGHELAPGGMLRPATRRRAA